MSNCESIITALEATTKRLEKEAILATAAKDGNLEFFDGARLALDPLVTFGVKKVPKHGGPDGQGLPWDAFHSLATMLVKRQLTGHAAKDAIELALGAATQSQWNDWYRRILIKDLRCGVSEKTVNKVIKKFKNIKPIPIFSCMLAHEATANERHMTGVKLLEPKLDGVRVLTIINAENRTVTQYSRNGRVLTNFGHITRELEKEIDFFDRSWVIDGEMVSDSFQALMKQVHRKTNVNAADAKLMAFDILPLSEFLAGKSAMGQRRRSKLLSTFGLLFSKLQNRCIEVVPQTEVDLDTDQGQIEYRQFNDKCLAAGFEGIMVKDSNGIYSCKRSVAWLKQKPFIEVSLTVVGYEEGTGKNQGVLGALIFEGEDDGKQIRVNVGGGYSDEQRADYWAYKDEIIGQIGEVRADVLTLNQSGDGVYSLRFPRFLRFRGFTPGEKM